MHQIFQDSVLLPRLVLAVGRMGETALLEMPGGFASRKPHNRQKLFAVASSQPLTLAEVSSTVLQWRISSSFIWTQQWRDHCFEHTAMSGVDRRC